MDPAHLESYEAVSDPLLSCLRDAAAGARNEKDLSANSMENLLRARPAARLYTP